MSETARTNHRVMFTGPGEVQLSAEPMPSPGPHDLVIRTRVSLVSPGTERAFFLGLPNTSQRYPQPAGYSNIGEVVAVGAAVKGFAVGDRVASAGHHAAYIAVPAAKALPVPPGLAEDRAVFFNLVSIALQGVRKARVELGEAVAVIGAGLIGLLALQLARLQGAMPTIAVDQDSDRLNYAQQSGADLTVPAAEQWPASLPARLPDVPGHAPAVVIEATGNPAAILAAFAAARPMGRVILLGSTRGTTDSVNFYRDIHRKGLTVIGAHNITRPAQDSRPGYWAEVDDQAVALRLLAHDRLLVEPYITHRFAWHDAPRAYELLRTWDRTALGMLLDWTKEHV